LYHYLLSFPYRLIAVFVHSLKGQVIALRFINIFFELCNLVILRLVFKRLRVSRTMSGIVILLFAFTPVFSQLSAQINYDNLLFPVTALAILQLIHFYDSLKKGDLRLGLLMSLAITCLLASLIQYEFLPIFFGIFLCVIWLLLRAYTLSFRKLKTAVVTAFWHLGRRTRTVLSALLVFSAAVFSRFYIVNIFRYGNPVPQCNQVLSIAQCKKLCAVV
jgi:hypothetical protein